MLVQAGWHVCDADQANITAYRGVAIREFPLPGHGFADYLLYIDGRAAGVIEAKKAGTTLSGDPAPRSRAVFAFHRPLVDRGNLADQTLKEFQQYAAPYNVFGKGNFDAPEFARCSTGGHAE